MEDLLAASSNAKAVCGSTKSEILIAEASRNSRSEARIAHDAAEPSNGIPNPTRDAESLEDVLRLLRTQPDTEVLLKTLSRVSSINLQDLPSLHLPGPVQAQINNAIVEEIIPTFWPTLDDHGQDILVSWLSTITGIGALVTKLRFLVQRARASTRPGSNTQTITDLTKVLETALRADSTVARLWKGLQEALPKGVKRDLAWKEAVALFGSGRIVSTVAEAGDWLSAAGEGTRSWLASGEIYTEWIARNLNAMLLDTTFQDTNPKVAAASSLLTKAFAIGYQTVLIRTVIQACLQHSASVHDPEVHTLASLLSQLPAQSNRRLLDATLQWCSAAFEAVPSDNPDSNSSLSTAICGLAFVLNVMSESHSAILSYLTSILADPALTSSVSLKVRRACIAAVASQSINDLSILLEKAIAIFGDPLFIKHAPILQQESMAQTILLTSGHLNSAKPSAVRLSARSSHHMQGVSNRLEASSPRARWLGMVVGTALSGLIDSTSAKLSFGTNDMETEEAKRYLGLVKVHDRIGTINDFLLALDKTKALDKVRHTSPQKAKKSELPIINGKPTFGPPRPPAPAVQRDIIGDRVTELADDEDDADEDLKPYAKPDSDPEDSDEDATLVNRNKPRPPVYIRTLMTMLRDTENAERFQLALKHAGPLIRRKKEFGREVTDHAEELARMFTGLQDPFDTENFDELRLQALIAVVLNDVPTLGPWMSRQVFAGEYSIAQRSVMLTALGLSGRELAGYKNDETLNPLLQNPGFPTKKLPSRLHAIYSPGEATANKRLEAASKQLEQDLIQPMALAAADQSTSHLNAVKVRTFSSRMDVERTKRKPAANALAKLLGEAYFFPLIGRFQQDVSLRGSSGVFTSTPFLLVTFIKTLSILLHASGPATLALPQITAEFWDVLLSLRVKATSDITVMEALLFAFLTLLDVNSDKRRIAEECPKQLMETKEWVDMVFERTGGGNLIAEGEGEEARVRTLAAGVLMKTSEVIEAYQQLLMGQWSDM